MLASQHSGLEAEVTSPQLHCEYCGMGRPRGWLTGCAAVNLIDLFPIQSIGSQHATPGKLPTRARTHILFYLGVRSAFICTVPTLRLQPLYRVDVSTRL